MTDNEAAALVAAGRILQSKSWPDGKKRIEQRDGENYPAAVMRAINSLPEADRQRLRALVKWVRDYELANQQT